MKKIFGILLLPLILVSCQNDDGPTTMEQDFLIFGHFYGECIGEGCVETFKLTDTVLYEDTIDDYTGRDLKFVALGNELFEQVKDLTDYFPDELLVDRTIVFGCPDCADGGGLFIQFQDHGTLKSWRIDQNKDNVPGYLHNFMDKVNEKIELIHH